MRSLRAFWRLLCATGHALRGWWAIRTRFHRLSAMERSDYVQQWSATMLKIFGIRLDVQGAAPVRGPVLVISNHISWLDIVVLNAVQHVRFVAKAGVRRWPLIGMLADGSGSLYIERERRRDAMRVMHHMAESLRAGGTLAVFPEGGIGDGVTLRPFHANLLQAAIATEAPVQPAALRFADAASGQTSFAPRYIGADSLLSSVWRTLRAPPLVAFVRLGDAQSPQGRDRREWSQALHAQVRTLHAATRTDGSVHPDR